jgi:putative transcriptional regulator
MTTLEPGALLVATPKLVDPNFFRTVVLLCSIDPVGAMGVVLNRPLEGIAVGEHLPLWAGVANKPSSLFQGGPVEPTAGIGVGVAGDDGPPSNWREFAPALGLIDLSGEPEGARPLRGIRVFLGYAGWTADQLEGEVEEGAWFVIAGEPGDVLDPEPGTLWRRVLQRQAGNVAMFAHFPLDPRAN